MHIGFLNATVSSIWAYDCFVEYNLLLLDNNKILYEGNF